MKQAINSIHPSRQIRTKSYFHSRLPYRRRFKWNQECPTKQQQQKSSPNNITYKLPSKEKRPQKIANKTTNLQHYSQVQTLTKQETTQTQQHATPLLNQRLLSTKRSPKQTPLARKSQRRDFEEV
ncbi:Hypothetical_protein [Hexamita inflata]|uniref:Hypothetical_protein n=1 Tax=Hexamita inflata TaxID=28002 RepID=A0AA86PFT3_9EUKA|nr:Hypothetical protein HINF_LOCUS22599 [Hexamita inflata]